MGGVQGRGTAADIFLVLACAAGLLLVLALVGPFGTNDGPLHISFARLFANGADGPLQQSFYTVSHAIRPNMLMYALAKPLIGLFGPDITEQLIQALALIGLPVSGWFAASAFGRSGPLVALLLFTLGLNQMFFLGLYNFALSLSLCLFAFGCAVRAERMGGWWWALFGAFLLFAVLAHAGGFIIAVILVGGWFLPPFVRDLASAPRGLVRRWWPATAAFVPAVLVLFLYLPNQPDTPTLWGPHPFQRVRHIIHFDSLRAIGTGGEWVARGFRLLSALLVGWVTIRRLRLWMVDPGSRFETVRLLSLLAAAGFLALLFPEEMGGGWGHARRMYFALLFALLILLAAEPLSPAVRRGLAWLATGLFAVMLAATAQAQSTIRALVQDSDALLSHVGKHCTLAPLLPLQGRSALPAKFKFEPLFNMASRVEHRDDRVVLFSNLATLGIYPVRYRPHMDPMDTLFHELGYQQTEGALLIEAFERRSGVQVDYVMTLGPGHALRPGLWPDFGDFRHVAASPTGQFHLYARKTPPAAGVRSACRFDGAQSRRL